MNFRPIAVVLISLTFSFCITAWLFKQNIKSTPPVVSNAEIEWEEHEGAEMGTVDDPDGWYQWEKARLADPETGEIPSGIRLAELAFASTLPKDNEEPYLGKTRGGLNFDNRGPFNVGGRTRGFAMDVNNPNILVAGSTSGDIWRSMDKGNSWVSVTPPSSLKGITCLVQDTRTGHTNTWYAGTGEAFGGSASAPGAYFLGNGMLKSTDNGLTWASLASTVSSSVYAFDKNWDLVWNVVADKSNTTQDIVYAATYGSIYRTTDGGANWTAVLNGGGSFSIYSYFTDVAITSTGVVYATMSSDGPKKGLWRSANGVNFFSITPPNFPKQYNRVVIGINPSNENEVYFLGNTPNAGTPDTNFMGEVAWNSLWKYTYLSGNGDSAGGVWQNLSPNLPYRDGPFDRYDSQGSYNMLVRFKPDEPNTVFIGGTSIFRSTTAFLDSLNTVQVGGYKHGTHLPKPESYTNHHPDQHVIFFDPANPDIMYNANDGGLYRTNDCTVDTVVWQDFNKGYLTSMFYTVALDHGTSGSSIVIGGTQDNGSWFTNSATPTKPWVRPYGGDGSYCAIADGGGVYYFSKQLGVTQRQILDANGNVTSFARIDPEGGKNYGFINPLILDPVDNNKMYMAGGRYLWRNDDLAGIPMAGNYDSIPTNWFRFKDSIPVGTISALACSKQPAHTLYYGTSNKKLYKVLNAHTGSPSRVELTSPLFPSSASTYVSCIAVDPHDANKLMVVFSNYSVYSLYYSDNAGVTWLKISGNLEKNSKGSGVESPSLRWAAFTHLPDGNLAYFVGTSIGLYATKELKDTSTIWTQQSANLIGNQVIEMIDYRESDGMLLVATHAKGIYSTTIASINDIVTAREIAPVVTGLKNYPNPFNTETTITFTLEKPAIITVKVFDLWGREIATLKDGWQNEGVCALPYNTMGLPGGVYFCRVSGQGIYKTIGMIKSN